MYKLKSDKYRKSRGGYSRLLELSCTNCKNLLFSYQKDGPGILKRLYLDRIFNFNNKNKKLICPKCKNTLGVLYIYEKENRPAYKLLERSISKKIAKIR